MAKEKKKELDREIAVIKGMMLANNLAVEVFGEGTAYATEIIFDYYEDYDFDNADCTEFAVDLKRMYEHAREVYKTDKPTPEQVFGVLARVFDDGEDDE